MTSPDRFFGISQLNRGYNEKLKIKHSKKKNKSWTVYLILLLVSLLLWYRYYTDSYYYVAILAIGIIIIYTIVINIKLITFLFSNDWIIVIISSIIRYINLSKMISTIKRYLYKVYKLISTLYVKYLILLGGSNNNIKQSNIQDNDIKSNHINVQSNNNTYSNQYNNCNNNDEEKILLSDNINDDNEVFYDVNDHEYLYDYMHQNNHCNISNFSNNHHQNTTTIANSNNLKSIDKSLSYYIETLSNHSLKIVSVEGDGNCLFRAVAHQILGDEHKHSIIRQKCMDYMEQNASFYSHFVADSTFMNYILERRKDGVWGDHLEIKAISDLYNCNVEIWDYDSIEGAKLRTSLYDIDTDTNINYYHTTNNNTIMNNNDNTSILKNTNIMNNELYYQDEVEDDDNEELQLKIFKKRIRLSYYGNNHYNSLVLYSNSS